MVRKSKSITIDVKLYEDIEEYAINQKLTMKNAIKRLLLRGLKELAPSQCEVCKEIQDTEDLRECSCDKKVHCGYLYIQSSEEYKGETWATDPNILCYFCMIENYQYGEYDFVNEKYVNSIDEAYKEIHDNFSEYLEDYVGELEGKGDSYMNTQTRVHSFEIVEPTTWKYLRDYLETIIEELDDEE